MSVDSAHIEAAIALLTARGLEEGMGIGYAHCSPENCGPGPRFILRVPLRTPVCFNVDELKEELAKHPEARGQALIDALVPFEPLPD